MAKSKTPKSKPAAADAELRVWTRLVAEIANHDTLYYQQDAPEISDAAYDALRKRLIELERAHPEFATSASPTQRVGAAPIAAFGKIRHDVAMLSLSNAFADEDVVEFADRVRRFLMLSQTDELEITAEPKIDGLSISLRFEGGVLTQAATRGDGAEGENVTANVKTIAEIPHRLKGRGVPEIIDVRGEIYLGHKDFAALNGAQESAGEKAFANPRMIRIFNRTGGTLLIGAGIATASTRAA